jgi:crotonobetainyl-CoA:carnitine CoA-transferase CaiB-like acyl-CoA transferase
LEKSPLAHRFFAEDRLAAVHPQVGVVDAVFRRDRPEQQVTDLVAVAAGGLLYCNGFPDRPPERPAGNLAYKQLSLVACAAAVALIVSRRLEGRGGRAVVGLQEAVMSTIIQAANQNLWRWQGAIARRAGLLGLEYPVLGQGRVALIRSGRTTYQCQDGLWVSFSIWPPRWGNFLQWLEEVTGSTELMAECWQDPVYRTVHRDKIEAAVAQLCAALPRDEVVRRGQELGLLVLPVNTVADIAADPHLEARGFYRDVWHPALGRHIRLPRSAIRSSAFEAELRPAPRLGEHTREVLLELAGLTETDVAALLERGVAATLAGQEEGEIDP